MHTAHTHWIDLSALWKIVVVGLLAGAGLPALFAVGLRALAHPGGTSSTGGTAARNPAGLAVAVLCFAVILAAIGYGIDIIVSGS